MQKVVLAFGSLAILWVGCTSPAGSSQGGEEINPPAPGFHIEESDPQAIALADSVMMALGGRKAWDEACCFSWNFFGRRHLWWDKHAQKARVEWIADSIVVAVHLPDTTGKAWIKGRAITDSDSLRHFLAQGVSAWINDSYWLFMPYKLKDSGVTLKYLGRDTTLEGRLAEVIQLTFEGVGETPQNKYRVYIDPDTHLVVQWDFFRNYTDAEPLFRTPWSDWRRYGRLMLSGDRGQRRITDIAVYDHFPPELFERLSAEKPAPSDTGRVR